MSFFKSSEGLSGAGDGRESPETLARIEHEIVDEQKALTVNIELVTKALADVNEPELDDTQHPVFLEIKAALEQAARLSAHA